MDADALRGILFAAVARRLEYVTDGDLDRARQARLSDPTRGLAEILLAQHAIDERVRAIVDGVVDSHIALHGADVEACFAALVAQGWIPATLVGDVAGRPTADGPLASGDRTALVPDSDAADVSATVTLGSYTSGGSRYELLERKGGGGMGEVWLACDRELNRQVLLKQVLPHLAESPQSRGNFLRETRTGAILEHPGIVPVYDIGQHPGGRLFQVMRYFKPGSLHKKIAAYHLAHPDAVDELAFRTLLGHFATACRAIEFVHTRGILHLDIKPSNIVTGDFGETQIIDWGLAQITDADMLVKVNEESGTLGSGAGSGDVETGGTGPRPALPDVLPRGLRGTPAYAAPEQWKGDPALLGVWSDVYGLGATLFEILAGKAPFKVPSPTLEEDVEIGNVHREMRPWAPAGLRAICRKAMAVKPADRYPSAAALADDVDRFLADEPVAAWPDPWRVRLWRFVKRHRTAVAAAAALLATTTVALAIGNVLVARERDQTEVARQMAEAQRERAERNASTTRQVIRNFIERVADDEWATIPGTTDLRLRAVQGVVDTLPDLIAEQPDNPDLRHDAALIDRRCANLYRVLGNLKQAATLYERSRAIMEGLVAAHPEVAVYRQELCHNRLEDAELIVRDAGPERALETLRGAVAVAEEALKAFPDLHGVLRTLAVARMDLADALVDAGRFDEGAEVADWSVKGFETVLARDGDDDEGIRFQTRLLAPLAAVVASNAGFEADRPDPTMAQKADRWSADLAARHSGDPNVGFVRALALGERARLLSREAVTAGDAEAAAVEGLDMLRALVASAPTDANFRPALAHALVERGKTLLASGQAAAAAALADEAIAAVAPIDQSEGAVEAKRCLARAHALRGRAALATGDAAAAKEHLRAAEGNYDAAVAAAPRNDTLRDEAAAVGRLLAE